MKLIFATEFDSTDIQNWSGLGFYYSKMLREAGFTDLHCLNVDQQNNLIKLTHSLKTKYNMLLGKRGTTLLDITQSKLFAQRIYNQIGDTTHVLSAKTAILAHLKKDLRKILYTDSTLDNLLNFYQNYNLLSENVIAQAQELEFLAVKNSNLLIYTSQWAADSAIHKYEANPQKVFIVPFGANLRFAPNHKELKSIVEKRDLKKHVNLLFVGVEWDRKGGEYAVKIAEKLNDVGINTTLHIVGIRNFPSHLKTQFIINHGFISKRTINGEKKLCNLIANSDFLVLPSLADCTPIVLSEANAFGVPCLVSEVGGNLSIIKSGINGKTFPLSNFVEDCTNYIIKLRSNKSDYEELCFSSYNEYEKELNWKSTGSKIFKLINSI